jgi:hypothetical protein
MGRHEPASNASEGYKVRSLRLVLNELAEQITQAWSDYDAQALPSSNAAAFVAPDANNAIETSKLVNSGFAVAVSAERKYEPSTQQMLRRIDALLAPFADERAASPDHDD